MVSNYVKTKSASLEEGALYLVFTYGGGYDSEEYCLVEICFLVNGVIVRIPLRKASKVSTSVSQNTITVTCSVTTIIMGIVKIG